MIKKKKQVLLQKQVKELFEYKDGKLFWKSKISHSTKSVGEKVGSICREIPRVKIYGRYYLVHRLVYLYHHGFCPKQIWFKDKTLTSEGMYDISIENLEVPPKKIRIKKNLKGEISFAKANAYFKYRNGRLYWKKKPENHSGIIVGSLAGSISRNTPYLRVTLHGKTYMQHRIVFLLHHKYSPEVVAVIDKTLTPEGVYDISIENLKEETISYSRVKNKARKGNTSKYRGVTFNKDYKKYVVRLSVEGVRRVIGKYQNEIDAAKRYDEVAKELIGEDAVLNFPVEK